MQAETLSDDATDQYLTFELAGELYGLDILKVQEIKGWEPVREIPNTPRCVKGILNLRGTIVPIIDLRVRFGLDIAEYTAMTVVIVLSISGAAGGQVMGIVADGVSDVLDVCPTMIRNTPDLGSNIDTRYIKGIVLDDPFVMLLEADKLLNPAEFNSIDGLV